MSQTRPNTKFFALRQPPPEQIDIGGGSYRLTMVFKHDFFAATCLYERIERPVHPAAPEQVQPPAQTFAKIVVKFGREHGFCGVPLAWLGRFNRHHEEALYRRLDGVEGLAKWIGRIGESGYAIEYLEGEPLDHVTPPPGFFDALRKVFDAVHARGVAYVDANKRSNILVGPDGRPFLVDFQISIRRRDDWPWPMRTLSRWLVSSFVQKDLYHLYKHKRRMAPQELTPQEEELSRNRSLLHLLHRKLTKPYRSVRRKFLNKKYRQGKLVSPTQKFETQFHQPEKDKWRNLD